MRIYQSATEGASPTYDFRRDFRALAQPGLHRFLEVSDGLEDGEIDRELRIEESRLYVAGVREALKSAQPWSAERAAEVCADFERAMTCSVRYVAAVWAENAPDRELFAAEAAANRRAMVKYGIKPEDLIRTDAEIESLRRMVAKPFLTFEEWKRREATNPPSAETLARRAALDAEYDQREREVAEHGKQVAAMYVEAETIAERDEAEVIAFNTAAEAILGHAEANVVADAARKFLTKRSREISKAAIAAAEAARADNVVELFPPKPKAETTAKPSDGPKRQAEQPKQREPMFKRIGELAASSREWLVRGFIPHNEACNPFGRPDSFKGVTAAQLCVHIAGGVPFLGMDVKQAPTAYFAAERGEQVKRRIKGHIQRLGLPDDLPCYFGERPINLLEGDDVQLMLEEIKAMERDAGAPIGFLVVDTQSRTQAGDENSTKDGAKYAAAIERLRSHTSITPWINRSHWTRRDGAGPPPRLVNLAWRL
jgi:AAA domain